VTLVVLLVVTGGVLYWVAVSMDPSLGPESYRVRSVGKAAAKYLSADPDVVSAKVDRAEADKNGSVVSVGASLKDGTSVRKAADLVVSVQQRTLEKESTYGGALEVSLSWKIGGNDIDVNINCRRDANRIRADILRAINPAGEPKAIQGDIDEHAGPTVDYGVVTATPPSLTQAGSPHSVKTFTLNGWKVTSTSSGTGDSFAKAPFEQIIAAGRAGQNGVIVASPFGDGTSILLSGLVSEPGDVLSVDKAAAIVHGLADCRSLGISRLMIDTVKQDSSSPSQLEFTCQDGQFTAHDDHSSDGREAEVLQHAAAL
jgi:hypothetical protein avisC_04384